MRCPVCDAVNSDTNGFCSTCGVAFATACRQCGHSNQPSAQFCGACGSVLAMGGQGLEDTAPRARWGERKQGTVLFADLVGSTQLIAELDPEQAMERLRPSLGLMGAAVKRFGGTVIRTLGDGMMAVFGVPRAQEAHALLACQAAIAIQRAFAANPTDVAVRIGLHSGELVISQDEYRPEPVPHGATIHLASRLEKMAEPGMICMTGECYGLVKLHCDVKFLGRREVKGFFRPIDTYALMGVKPAVASQQFRALNLSPLHGRDDEFDRLKRAMNCTETGDTRIIGISGAAGTGKSRLCFEFAEWCRRRSIPVLEARAMVSGEATPLQPVLEFLRLLLGVSATDDEATARAIITGHPATAGLDRDADIPLLLRFLGVLDPDMQGPVRPGRVRLRQIVGHLVRQGGTEPALILFEDLHWLDPASAEFIGEIAHALAGTHTMLVVNFRQSFVADWMTLPGYEQIALTELDDGQIGALVDRLLGPDRDLRPLARQIAERSGGNPFFAEELVRSLAERGVIRGEIGQFSLGPWTDAGLLPPSVQAIIGARIDGLALQEKTIVHIAAIIGKDFTLDVIEQVAGVADDQIETIIDHLHEAGFIEPRHGAEDRAYFFRHPLMQEVAYTGQLKSRRGELHAAVAEALVRKFEGRLDEFAALIGHHYEAAGQRAQAAVYIARAAVWIGSAASAQALEHWHKVRRLLMNGSASENHDTLRMRASGQIAMFGWREGMTAEEARPFIDEALGWARKIDNSMMPLLLAADGRIAVASGHPADEYVARINEALAIESQHAEAGRIATLNAMLCHASWLAGDLNKALDANRRALRGVDSIGSFDQQFLGLDVEQWMKSLRGRVLVRLGRFDDAETCVHEVLAIEESLLDPAVQFIPHLASVDLAWFRGDAHAARDHADRIAQIAEKSGAPYLKVYALGCLGAARCVAGDFTGAISRLAEAIDFARSARAALEFEPEMMSILADCHYRLEDFDQAAELARQTIDLARRRSARLAECRAAIIAAAAVAAARNRDNGASAHQEIERLSARAEELIRITGARVFEDRLARERILRAIPG